MSDVVSVPRAEWAALQRAVAYERHAEPGADHIATTQAVADAADDLVRAAGSEPGA